jgi:hypothetical protein
VDSKEFNTEGTELRHRDRGDVPEIFSVHSVLNWFDNAKEKTLRELCVKRF